MFSYTKTDSPIKLKRSSSKNNKLIELNTNTSKPYNLKIKKTHHIDLINIRDQRNQINESENIITNFKQIVKQIIDTSNTNFLDGNINLIEYILSKFTNTPLDQVTNFESISLKINYECGLLNQFGIHLPKLKILRLNNSVIPSISDIGSTFVGVTELYISNTGLKDLNGML